MRESGRIRVGALIILACAALAGALLNPGSARTAEDAPVEPGSRAVLFVANNWDGTADVVDPQTLKSLERFNVVPDLQERLTEIYTDPVRTGYFLAIRELIGEGHDQFADDMFSSHDGRFVYISRPSLADVVGMDLRTKQIVWRFTMDGQRSDHMAISPDGTRLLVSDSTARKVHVLNAADGRKVGEFESGDSPHENNYSADGALIFHASIGMVYTPGDAPTFDSAKGDRYFQIVDARTYKVLKRLDIGKILADNGFPGQSSAVRPMAISPDEKTVYLQLSFLHGFVEFDLGTEKPRRIVELPIAEKTKTIPREQYLLDSAHHGLAIDPDGTKLCAAGTMSDYAAIVSTRDFSVKTFDGIDKPYWSTNSGDGRYCFVSASGSDEVVVIDYAAQKEVARIGVGDHPQRMRMGSIRREYLGGDSPAAPKPRRAAAKLKVLRAGVRGGKLTMRLQMTSRARGSLRATYIADRMRTRFTIPIPVAAARRAGARGSTVTWTGRHRLSARQRRARTGVLVLSYRGSAAVRGDGARARVRRSPR